MKLVHAAIALLASVPVVASAASFRIDFEHQWDYADGDIAGYYAGGSAADGTSGANLGVSFVNVSGLSNDADFTYYTGAPSPLGVAYAYGASYIDVAGGVDGALTFWYSSPTDVTGAISVWSGPDGTGTLLGTYDLAANSSDSYDGWTQVTISFEGYAQSFDLSGASGVAFDNLSAVPETGSFAMMLAGAGLLAGVARRRRG